MADEEKERLKADKESGVLDQGFDDSYDKHIRELAFDRRAKPQDRMKTEEEIAQDEVEKLEKAEKARKRRMEGLDEDEEEKEISGFKKRRKAAPAADDLGDDFAVDEDDETFGLGTGMSVREEEFKGVKSGRMPSKKRKTVKVDKEESESEGEDEDEDDEEGDEDEEGSEGEEDEDEDEEDEDDDEDSDGFSDLDMEMERPSTSKSTEDQDEDEDDMNDMSAKPKKAKVEKKAAKSEDAVAAASELPYTFPCPTSLTHFLTIIEGIQLKDVPTVVHRIRALYHPKLSPRTSKRCRSFTPSSWITSSRSLPRSQSSLLLPSTPLSATSTP